MNKIIILNENKIRKRDAMCRLRNNMKNIARRKRTRAVGKLWQV